MECDFFHAYNNNSGEFKAALNPIYSGEVINGSHSGKGDYGIYRTSTIKTQYGSRYIVLMMVGSWNTVDGYETYKTYEGDSIRCVTK